MPALKKSQAGFIETLENAIHLQIERIAEDEYREAVQRIQRRVREKIGEMAISVVREAKIEDIGDGTLRIEVKISGDN